MRIFLLKGYLLLYRQESKLLRGQKNTFFQGRKTSKSKLTVRRQRKRTTDVAGCLEPPPGRVRDKSLTMATLFLNSSSSHPVEFQRGSFSLGGEPGTQDSDPACQSAHMSPPLLQALCTSPLLSHTDPTSQCLSSLHTFQPVQHIATNVPKCKPDLAIHCLIAFKSMLHLQDRVQIPHPGIPVTPAGTHSPAATAVAPGSTFCDISELDFLELLTMCNPLVMHQVK